MKQCEFTVKNQYDLIGHRCFFVAQPNKRFCKRHQRLFENEGKEIGQIYKPLSFYKERIMNANLLLKECLLRLQDSNLKSKIEKFIEECA